MERERPFEFFTVHCEVLQKMWEERVIQIGNWEG